MHTAPVINDFGDLAWACAEINKKYGPELDSSPVPFTPFTLPALSQPSSPRRRDQGKGKRGRDGDDGGAGERPAANAMQTEAAVGPTEVNLADGDSSDSERMDDVTPDADVTATQSTQPGQGNPPFIMAPVSQATGASSPDSHLSGGSAADPAAATVPPGFRAAT